MESTRNIRKITSDLERYKRIADYYQEHPERKKPNESYLIDVAVELIAVSEKELPKELEVSCSDLLNTFYRLCD